MPQTKTVKNKPRRDLRLEFHLDEVDKKMLAYKVEYPAMTDYDLADLMDMDRPTIQQRRVRPLWQKAFEKAVMPAEDYLQDKLKKAVQMYWNLAASKNENVAERVLRNILLHYKLLRLEPNQMLGEFDPIVVNMPLFQKTVMIVEKEKQVVETDSNSTPPAGTVQ